MKIQKILDNFKSLPVAKYDADDLNDFLLTMFQEHLGAKREEDLLSLVAGRELQIRVVYDLHVGHEHYCSLRLLCVDGAPVAFEGHHGYEDDAHGEATVVNKELGVELAGIVAAGLAQRRLAEYSKDVSTPESGKLLDLGGGMFMSELSDSVVGVREDASLLQDSFLREPFSAWVRLHGEPLKVLSFLRRDTEDGRSTFANTEKGEVRVEHGNVVFQFMDSTVERSEALERMAATGDWYIRHEDCSDVMKMVSAYVRPKHSWSHDLHVITFDRKADYLAFTQKYPFDRKVGGDFPFESIPDNASVVS